jgi:glutamine---fructose-6-phosphate transaminase (isomerizing)
MTAGALGLEFEREIREQPDVWERIARSDKAQRLAHALRGEVVIVGSGSSLFVGELFALALRRRAVVAHALAATEARLDHGAYSGRTTVAISQSGRSSDLLEALEVLKPASLVALTNQPQSPLGEKADVLIDVGAGAERAVPASKSVSGTVAIALWAAALHDTWPERGESSLRDAAQMVHAWLDGDGVTGVEEAGRTLATGHSTVFLGSDYGLPIAREAALKLKEAAYLHAEGMSAGEFRHGSIAMVDAATTVVGIADADALEAVARPLRELEGTGARRYTIGMSLGDLPRLGPELDVAFNTLGWLVAAQLLALYASRARGIDADAPRGLTKALVDE